MSTVTDLPVELTRGQIQPSDFHARSNAMSLMQYQLVKEMHRERLRQAEHYRLRRAVLRARRMLAQGLMR